MKFLIIVLLALVGLASSETDDTTREGRFINYKKKNYGDVYKKYDLEETKRSEEYAGDALNGMYMECFAQISFSCVQKKVLSFINRMNRMEKFSVLGNYVSVVRTKNEYEPESQFQARLNTAEETSGLDQLMETSIDRYDHLFAFGCKDLNAIFHLIGIGIGRCCEADMQIISREDGLFVLSLHDVTLKHEKISGALIL